MPGPATDRQAQRAGDGGRPWLASYPEGVPADYDFPLVPLTRLLDDAAASWPSGTALAFFGTRISYRELKDAVDRFAAALAGLGVGKGDRVGVVLPNCPQNVIATYAALRLGAVVVQHNPLYTEPELRHQLADCGATVVVCLDRVYEAVARVRRDTAVQHVVVTSMVDYLSTTEKLALRLPLSRTRRTRAELTATVPKGAPVRPFLGLLKSAPGPAPQTPLDPMTDLALLQYTGGTTGRSKGAMLTHHNLVSNAYMNRLWDTGATPGREVCLAVLPLFHAYGLTVCMNATLLLGGTLVLLPRFDLDRVFTAIEQWRPTMFPGVPPIYQAISDSPRARTADLSSIRICVSGAMRLPEEVAEQFERVSGARLIEGYGLTETSPSTHCNPVTGPRKPGTIGLPLPGTECRIVDPEDCSRQVPPGEAGELAVRGPQVFRGYWGREDAEGVFTDDGFLLTGDIVVMDDDGYFTVVDRKKELIIAGGFNIYPSEVEAVLGRLPGVAEAAVVGVPDRYRGETVKAFVVPAPGVTLTEDDVVAHCAGELAAYKVPKLVEFRDALPRTEVGKVLRRVLVDEERAKQAELAQAVPGAAVPGAAVVDAAAADAAVPDAAIAGDGDARAVGADANAADDEVEATRAATRRGAVRRAARSGGEESPAAARSGDDLGAGAARGARRGSGSAGRPRPGSGPRRDTADDGSAGSEATRRRAGPRRTPDAGARSRPRSSEPGGPTAAATGRPAARGARPAGPPAAPGAGPAAPPAARGAGPAAPGAGPAAPPAAPDAAPAAPAAARGAGGGAASRVGPVSPPAAARTGIPGAAAGNGRRSARAEPTAAAPRRRAAPAAAEPPPGVRRVAAAPASVAARGALRRSGGGPNAARRGTPADAGDSGDGHEA